MAKNQISDWDTNADANTDVGGNNIGENCPPSTINNAIRTIMAQIKVWFATVPVLSAINTFTASQGIGATPGGAFTNGKALALGDADTGIRQNGEGVIEIWTDNVSRVSVTNTTFTYAGNAVACSDSGTYTMNITGSASQLGGVAAANYLQTANLGSEFSLLGLSGIGSIAMLSRFTGGTFAQGDTSLGTQLRYSNADGSSTAVSPPGTWICLGRAIGGTGAASVTLWKRIS